MKKCLKYLIFSFLVFTLGMVLFNNSSSSYEVKNVLKQEKDGIDYTSDVNCITEDEVIGTNYETGTNIKLSDLKAVVRYYYGNSEIEICDNPNLNLLPSISACELEGWYYDKELTQKVTGTTIGDVMGNPSIEVIKEGNCIKQYNYITNIYAKCKEAPKCPTDMPTMYKINYVIDNTVYSKVDVKVSEKVVTPSPTKEGYIFDGWYTDANLKNKFTGSVNLEKIYDENNCTTGYKTITLYGKWVKNNIVCDPVTENFNLIYNTNGGNNINTIQITSNNKNMKIENPVKEGYVFNGWYSDEKLTKKFDAKILGDITPQKIIDANGCTVGYKNITIYAAWSQNATVNPDTGDNIIVYCVLGLILIIGCIVLTKKLVNK